MCTAIGIDLGDFYFGRTLDVEQDYGQEVALTPKTFDYQFRFCDKPTPKFDLLGMALNVDGYPLYFDAINNNGLCMAGLRFSEFCPNKVEHFKTNVAPFELIPLVLTQCGDIFEAEKLLEEINVVNEAFSKTLPITPLHWIVSDKNGSLTVEQTKYGLMLSKNPVGVLTNSPEFNIQMHNLNNYIGLSRKIPNNEFCPSLPLTVYSYGMGALGLPGDASSMSRFIRATYYKYNMVSSGDPIENFYYLLNSCRQIKGLTKTETDNFEYTAYASCCNATKGEYYYKKYGDQTLYKATFKGR